MKSKLLSSFVLLLPILMIACGGSSADDPTPAASTPSSAANETEPAPSTTTTTPATGAAACEAAGNAICARACACATDGKCHVGVDIGMETAASVNFDNETKCRDFYVKAGCYNGGEPGFDYGTCKGKVEAAACVDSASGLAGHYPAECRVTKK